MPYADPRMKAAYQHRYYSSNKTRLKTYARKYHRAHREEAKAYYKQWKKEHPNWEAEWRAANRDKKSKNQKKWQLKNLDKCRAQQARRRSKQKGGGGSFTSEEFKNLCKKYKHRCLRCNLRKKLTPDHVIPVSKGGSSNISNIQPLCQSCNSKKNDKCIDYRKGK